MIRVEVAYALPGEQALVAIEVPAGTTAQAALERSGLASRFGIEPARARVGVFGREVALQAELHDGDRLEVYRPLALDPKERRRRRAGRPTSAG
jgi:uncharacterized protein